MWPSRGVCSLSVRCVLTWTFLITPAHLGLSGALDCSRGVCSLSVRCALTWTFLITPAHLGLSGALDCNRGVCSLSVRCALTWTCLITPAHLGLSGALGRSRGACSLTGGGSVVAGTLRIRNPFVGWYVDPRNQKDLMQTKIVKKIFRRGRLRGWYASPRIQKDLMQTKKVSNSQLRTPAGRRRCLALRFPPLLPFFFLRKGDLAAIIVKSDGFVRGVPD